MQYSNTFIRISWPILELNKSCIDQFLGQDYFILGGVAHVGVDINKL